MRLSPRAVLAAECREEALQSCISREATSKVQRIWMMQQSFQNEPANKRTSGTAPFYGQLKIHPLPQRAEATALGEPRESFFIEMTVFMVYK